jgi:hypothetical protein
MACYSRNTQAFPARNESRLANTVHVLSPEEAHNLMCGETLSCRDHEHCTRDEARQMTMGGEHFPDSGGHNYKPEAYYATLPSGKTSEKHIVMTVDREWRKVTARTPLGAAFHSSMQLVSRRGYGA